MSVLIAEGADPRARSRTGGYSVPHHAAILAQGDGDLTLAVEVLRYFIGGLHSAGLSNDEGVWNVESGSGLRPLELMDMDFARYSQNEEGHAAEVGETHSLMYERGARCGVDENPGAFSRSLFCRVPVERVRLRVSEATPAGDVLTLVARDFGGAVFSMPPPDAGKTAQLESGGWTLRALESAPSAAAGLVLSRSAEATPAVFTITMRDADNRAAREFRTRAETSHPALASLRAAVAAGDAGRTRELTDVLGPAYRDVASEDGVTPLLMRAASLGHAEVVSVLIVAGHNPDARHPFFYDFNTAHIASFYPDTHRSRAWNLLRHFGDAIDESGAAFDWNGTGELPLNPLDLLAFQNIGDPPGADAGLLRMSDYMLRRGARCEGVGEYEGYREYLFAPACAGSFGLTLANEIARAEGPRVAETRAAVEAMAGEGLDPNVVGVFGEGLVLPLAASLNYAAAVSVLVSAGLNPDGRSPDGFSVLDYAARNAAADSGSALEVLRHFIGGLHGAGVADSFDGWNEASEDEVGVPPLGALSRVASVDDVAANEIHALMYERGGRCDSDSAGVFCEVPVEVFAATVSWGESGDVLYLTARDFGGAVFSMLPPDAGKVFEMSEGGWTLRLDDEARGGAGCAGAGSSVASGGRRGGGFYGDDVERGG